MGWRATVTRRETGITLLGLGIAVALGGYLLSGVCTAGSGSICFQYGYAAMGFGIGGLGIALAILGGLLLAGVYR